MMNEQLDKVVDLACEVFQVGLKDVTLSYRAKRWTLTIHDSEPYVLRDLRHDKKDWVEFDSLEEIIEGLKVFRRYGSYEAYHKAHSNG